MVPGFAPSVPATRADDENVIGAGRQRPVRAARRGTDDKSVMNASASRDARAARIAFIGPPSPHDAAAASPMVGGQGAHDAIPDPGGTRRLAAGGLPGLLFAGRPRANEPRQVRAELVRIEQAGFDPLREPLEFPADIQAAEARLAASGATAVAATPALPALANAAGGHASTTPRVTSVASATHDGGVENGDAPALSH